MELYKSDNDYKIYKGNSQDMLEFLKENSIDAIVTDPPYELGFMGKKRDGTGIAYDKEFWRKCYKVLKSGGYLLAFGGSRTFHRIACAIEDAGFEIRDTIMWLYGSGFPKSLNIGLAIDKKNGVDNRTGSVIKGVGTNNTNSMKNGLGCSQEFKHFYEERKAQNKYAGYGTCLKPAYEPIIMARKPVEGTVADNMLKYGVGAINIDECRIPTNDDLNGGAYRGIDTKKHEDASSYFIKSPKLNGKKYEAPNGRFPANVITDGSDEVKANMPDTKSHGGDGKKLDTRNMGWGFKRLPCNIEDDGGNVCRYFYCAKASKKDRDEGLENFEDKKFTSALNTKNGSGERLDGAPNPIRKNIHPTVKPTELMQYLIRLVAPKGSVILDPFCGSGSTGKACMFENRERNANYKFIGIEMTDEYLPMIVARIDYAKNKFEYDKKIEEKKTGQMNLFDIAEDK